MRGREVGRVAALLRYPVKSMQAEALEAVDVGWHGLAGDRRWAFIRNGMMRSGFPWLTIRERSDMGCYQPRFVEPARPDVSPTMVRTPSGDEFDVVDPALAAELGHGTRHGVRVIKQDRGIFDTMPLSVITTQTVASLSALINVDLDLRRFRPNIVVESTGSTPFAEDSWVGLTLRIGNMENDVRMRVDQRDRRCVIVNVDPITSRRDPAILRAIARERQAYLGVYGSTVQSGHVAVGDSVVIET